MQVTLDSPEKKWQGVNLVPFPQGRHFCFFSQVPDCLYFNQLLQKARQKKKKRFSLFVVWDNYPYLQDQLVGVGKNLFSPATLKYDGEINGRIRYILEIEGQIVLYHFSKNYTFEKLAWISQGITLVPPGEEESGIENQ